MDCGNQKDISPTKDPLAVLGSSSKSTSSVKEAKSISKGEFSKPRVKGQTDLQKYSEKSKEDDTRGSHSASGSDARSIHSTSSSATSVKNSELDKGKGREVATQCTDGLVRHEGGAYYNKDLDARFQKELLAKRTEHIMTGNTGSAPMEINRTIPTSSEGSISSSPASVNHALLIVPPKTFKRDKKVVHQTEKAGVDKLKKDKKSAQED